MFENLEQDSQNRSLQEIMGRGRYQKVHEMKAGQALQMGRIANCRKIYYSCGNGSVELKISGNHNLTKTISQGYEGGPWGPGGGAFNWGSVSLIFKALSDATIYIHIEWTESPGFDIDLIERTDDPGI